MLNHHEESWLQINQSINQSQFLVLQHLAISAKMALDLRQGLASVAEAHVVDDDLGLLEEAHLDHVLERRAQDDHLDALPFAGAHRCLGECAGRG